jgi:hypothetical protein
LLRCLWFWSTYLLCLVLIYHPSNFQRPNPPIPREIHQFLPYFSPRVRAVRRVDLDLKNICISGTTGCSHRNFRSGSIFPHLLRCASTSCFRSQPSGSAPSHAHGASANISLDPLHPYAISNCIGLRLPWPTSSPIGPQATRAPHPPPAITKPPLSRARQQPPRPRAAIPHTHFARPQLPPGPAPRSAHLASIASPALSPAPACRPKPPRQKAHHHTPSLATSSICRPRARLAPLGQLPRADRSTS